eukprot:9109547-Ditylum_brightwellii.AAC.1
MATSTSVHGGDHSAPSDSGCVQGQQEHPKPRDFATFRGFSLNANGMKQDQKLETVSYLLTNSTADFFCLQETWLE